MQALHNSPRNSIIMHQRLFRYDLYLRWRRQTGIRTYPASRAPSYPFLLRRDIISRACTRQTRCFFTQAQATINTTVTTTTEVAAFVDGVPVMTAADKADTADSLSKPPTTPSLAITSPTTGVLPLTPTFSPAAEKEAAVATATATSFGGCLGSEGKRRSSGTTDEARQSDTSSDSRSPCQVQQAGTVAIISSNAEVSLL